MKKRLLAVSLSALLLVFSPLTAFASNASVVDANENMVLEEVAEEQPSDIQQKNDAGDTSVEEAVNTQKNDNFEEKEASQSSGAETSQSMVKDNNSSEESQVSEGEEISRREEDTGESGNEIQGNNPLTAEKEEQDTDKAAAEEKQGTDLRQIQGAAYEMPVLYAGDSMTSATSISLGSTYSGSITSSNQMDFYKFTLSTSGTVSLSSTANIEYVYYKLFDASGSEIWSTLPYWNTSSEQIVLNEDICLTSGTYYIEILRYGSNYGSYTFRTSFATAGESFKEVQGGSNNSLSTSDSITLGRQYKGQIALNDDRDFYKFTLSSSGLINLSSTANIEYAYYKLFDASGSEIWSTLPYWNTSSEQIVLDEDLHLTSGTYYLEILRYGSNYGNYSFTAAFTSAGESFKESQGGSDNSISSSRQISLNTDYKGQLALNDEKDFYKFTLSSADTLQVSATANMQYLYYKIFDASGNEVWSKLPYWNSSTQKNTINESVDLSAGTYYFEVERYGSRYGNYSFNLGSDKNVSKPSSVSGLKIGGRAADALRLNWNKSSNASGYIVEQYKNGSWTRIARIASGNTLTYRVSGLSASTTYQFRVKSFGYSGSTPIYSVYTYINGKTNPSIISGLKIGGRATDALRLNWNKNSKASGYIIEQYKNGTWTRIARIASNSTVTYRIAGLSAATTYQFRIKAFGYDGSTAIYSAYTTISGKTLPTAVTGLKIGGRAADALRLNWNKNSKASGYIIEQYKNGTWTRIARIASNSTVTYRIAGLSATTTYQFRIKAFAFDGSTAIYSAYTTISGTTLSSTTVNAPSAVSGLKIGGRATDALRLNWNKNSAASGYIIEQYKNGQWVRIARIANNSTVTYRIAGLSASTTYQFRIKAFSFNGSTPLYSSYKTISGKTLPTAVTGLRIGGTASDALRLNWNRNSKASGYIVEQFKNGSWVRIARIGTNSTLTYRVENLQSGMAYVFRVQSFSFDGSTPLYSSYQYISGVTNG